jgi:hypothetical protein
MLPGQLVLPCLAPEGAELDKILVALCGPAGRIVTTMSFRRPRGSAVRVRSSAVALKPGPMGRSGN